MRYIISFLALIMFLFLGNIIAYVMSEDYRFFLKKIKYNEQIVYDENPVDDNERYQLVERENQEGDIEVGVEKIDEDVFFLTPNNTEQDKQNKNDELRELLSSEQKVLDAFKVKFVLRELENIDNPLFALTGEYPDKYREYANAHMSLYMFPTKSYTEVKDIFQVLRYELPISLNEVNNFGQASAYINIESELSDSFVRIIFEYENMAFWLKIKKDSYNRAKDVLGQLG